MMGFSTEFGIRKDFLLSVLFLSLLPLSNDCILFAVQFEKDYCPHLVEQQTYDAFFIVQLVAM